MTAESSYTPTPSDRFTFGLWTVGNVGRDPFGEPTRPAARPGRDRRETRRARGLRRVAARQRSGARARERGRARPDRRPLRGALERDRARRRDGDDEPLHAAGLQGRRLHRERSARAPARAAEDDGRDGPRRRARRADLRLLGRARGSGGQAAKGAQDALERYREALNFLCEYALAQGYDMRFALEPKPNEPRGDAWLPTVGHALHMISTLDRPERWSASTPRSRTRHGGALLQRRGRAGAVGGQALPRRPERAAPRSLRPGLPVRRRRTSRTRSSSSACSRRPATRGPRHFDARPLRVEGVGGHLGLRRAAACART